MSVILLAAFIAMAALHLATLVLAGHRLWRAGDFAEPPGHTPPVSVIRPVCGLENGIEESLYSGFAVDYPEFELVFCVEFPDDEAIPLLRRLMAEHAHVPARLLIGDERVNINPKLNNVVKGYRAARHDFLMMVDSNVVMPRRSLRRVLGEWTEKTGAISAPGIGSAPDGLPAEIECAFLNTYQARWLYAADRLGLGYAQGKMMLFRRSDLERAGGLAALAAEVAEDSGLTKAMRRLGLDVRLTGGQFLHPIGRRSFAEMWGRQLRWAKLRRACFPRLYAQEIAACPLVPLGLLAGLVMAGGWSFGWLALLACLLYGGEAVLARLAKWRLGPLSPGHWIIRDLLTPPLWLLGWTGGGFEWRGHGMTVEAEAPAAGKAASAPRARTTGMQDARQ